VTSEIERGEAAPAAFPLRVAGHICVCVIIIGHTDKGMPIKSSCVAFMDNPDQPFCDGCTRQGHENQADPHEVAKKIEMMSGREPA
jgi:hypothetical protein